MEVWMQSVRRSSELWLLILLGVLLAIAIAKVLLR